MKILSAYRSDHEFWCLFTVAKQRGDLSLMAEVIDEASAMIASPLLSLVDEVSNEASLLCLCPIPPRRDRLIKRGFSPQHFFAERLKQHLQSSEMESSARELKAINRAVICDPQALVRRRVTRSQTGLKREDRLKEQMNSLACPIGQADEPRRCMIIIDDVITTGSTLREGNRALSHSQHITWGGATLFHAA